MIIPEGEINFLNELRQIKLKDMNVKAGQILIHENKFNNYGAKTSDCLPKLLKKVIIVLFLRVQ